MAPKTQPLLLEVGSVEIDGVELDESARGLLHQSIEARILKVHDDIWEGDLDLI